MIYPERLLRICSMGLITTQDKSQMRIQGTENCLPLLGRLILIVIALIIASAMTVGCTTPPQMSQENHVLSSPAAAPSSLDYALAKFVATAKKDQIYNITLSEGAKPIKVRLGKQYYSGAGMICRRIIFVEESASSGVPIRTGCYDNGTWRIFGIHGP